MGDSCQKAGQTEVILGHWGVICASFGVILAIFLPNSAILGETDRLRMSEKNYSQSLGFCQDGVGGIRTTGRWIADVRRAWPDLSTYTPTFWTWSALVCGIMGMITLAIVAGVAGYCIKAFVVPLMYLRDLRAWPATKLFFSTLFMPHLGSFVLFFSS